MMTGKQEPDWLEKDTSLFETHLNEWQTLLKAQKQARNQLRINSQKRKMTMSLRELTSVENWTNLVRQQTLDIQNLQELQARERKQLKAHQHQERTLFNQQKL